MAAGGGNNDAIRGGFLLTFFFLNWMSRMLSLLELVVSIIWLGEAIEVGMISAIAAGGAFFVANRVTKVAMVCWDPKISFLLAEIRCFLNYPLTTTLMASSLATICTLTW